MPENDNYESLDYKNKSFSDYDPLADFTVD